MGAKRGLRGDDAVADLVGTFLLVALSVVLGALVLAVVVSTLEAPQPARGSFAMGAADAGSLSASLLYRNGEAIPASDLRVGYQRDGTSELTAPSFSTTNLTTLRPGDRLTFPLSPALGANEKLTIRIYQKSSNVMLAELSSRAGSAGAALPLPTMTAGLSVSTLPNDSVSSTLVWARLSHPRGTLSVARVVADLSRFSPGTIAELGDAGFAGDVAGGDGNWSALVRIPSVTPAGSYLVFVNATDATGRLAASSTLTLTITPNSAFAASAASAGQTTTYGNVTNGSCYNCTLLGGAKAYEGTRFIVPSSASITGLRVRNFTWDKLHPARLDEDAAIFRITDGNHSFTAVMDFTYSDANNVPSVVRLTYWTDTAETVYLPRNGTSIALAGVDLDLMRPTASLQWIRASGSFDGQAYYQAARVTDPATLIVEVLRDAAITGQQTPAESMGLYTFDVVTW